MKYSTRFNGFKVTITKSDTSLFGIYTFVLEEHGNVIVNSRIEVTGAVADIRKQEFIPKLNMRILDDPGELRQTVEMIFAEILEQQIYAAITKHQNQING